MQSKYVVFVSVLLLLVGGIFASCGVNFGDIVHTKTPTTIQQQTGLPSSLSLNEAVSEYQAWFDDVKRAGEEWKDRIDNADAVAGALGQLTLSGLDAVGPVIGGIPILGPLLPGLTGIAGLLVGRSRLNKEKEASFNKGLEKGAETATQAA